MMMFTSSAKQRREGGDGEHHVTGNYYASDSAARNRCFPSDPRMVVTIVAAILAPARHRRTARSSTRRSPTGRSRHFAAVKIEIDALTVSARAVDEVNH